MIPFTAEQVATLTDLTRRLGSIKTVLIGASAVNCYVSMDWRRTEDLDVVVAIDLDGFGELTRRLVGWSRHPRREHEWRSPAGARVDVVPAGPALLDAGVLVWPVQGNVMRLTGLDLAFAHARAFDLGEVTIAVAPPAVLVLLKMIAWLDRPDREHDLADLAHLMEGWLAIDDERRFEADVMENIDWYEDVPPFLLGRDLGAVSGPSHRSAVEKFIARVGDDTTAAHGRLQALSPTSWRNREDGVVAKVEAFRRGFALGAAGRPTTVP